MDDNNSTAALPVIDLAATRRALAKKIIVNITVGLVVTVGSTLIINAIDRKFNDSEDSTEN